MALRAAELDLRPALVALAGRERDVLELIEAAKLAEAAPAAAG